MRLVWLVDPVGLFEADWIHDLFVDENVEVIIDIERKIQYTSAVLVINHTFDYERYLQSYTIPFAVIHLSDETLGAPKAFYHSPYCQFVFRNYHDPRWDHDARIYTFGLGYKQGFAKLSATSLFPWYHWCFAGNLHDQRRVEAIQAFAGFRPALLHTSHGGFNSSPLSLAEYRQMIEYSKFALCPMGQGNLDTFRLYEILEAEGIPVTLRKTTIQPYDYFRVVLGEDPTWIIADTWEECANRVAYLLDHPREYMEMRIKTKELWQRTKNRWRLSFQRACQHCFP